ncbi:MAG TPA: Holliday junction branch migration protein RuvA [Firmicutes bacterium]|nr:Holliday junction branch migration protein RuvA [Bacillota bacterium]HBK60109.1 Holliday junction branch migration protein RuvA [Bacillota bacterium]
MISQLRGRVVGIDRGALIIDVGGVGFRVSATAGARAAAGSTGSEARLFTEMVVKEDCIDLYGFETADERELFGILREVKGVGPKTALSILSALSAERLVMAVSTGDVHTLASAPGVGKRTAERLAMELRDKVGRFAVEGIPDPIRAAGVGGGASGDAKAALLALGYSTGEADRAVAAAVAAGYTDNASAIIRAALARLSRAE